ncbi:unnamed protein product [Danaus chrysippus]|uniref:(African queen) hypothetical protein n=1 Tax=Danaus chrysippus TaxID=151541 RepID=A0A8J2W826_9NEOP|nr:unnamed protein product [Danaus chrysippus]
MDSWRYSTLIERSATILGAVFSFICSIFPVASVIVYAEITGLMIKRHNEKSVEGNTIVLNVFGGGRVVGESNRTEHMDALVDDSVSYLKVSVIIMALQMITAATSLTLTNWAAMRMACRLRFNLLRSVLSQEIAYFDTNTSMNFATTLTDDVEKLKNGVGQHVAMTTYLASSVVVSSVVALAYGWQLTLAGMAVIPVALLAVSTVTKYQTRCSSDEVSSLGTAGRIVEQALSAIRTVRAYSGEHVEVDKYSKALAPARKAASRRSVWAGLGAGVGWFLTFLMNGVILVYGTALCVRDEEEGHYHPGIMITIMFCTYTASQHITLCNPHIEVFSQAKGAAKSLFKIMERKSKINALEDSGTKPEGFKGNIVFDNLYFNYPSRPDVKVLRGLSLTVNAGETVALVGGSGCGKSTLLQLLQRAYEPDSGQIFLDGHKLDSLLLHHYRRSIGVVGQEPVLFSGTIRYNITIGLENVSESDMIKAAQIAHAHQFIIKLSNGYDTILGESGAQLSGGQKQRIAIARALVRKPAVLLLDEPTSALDPASERQVQAALDSASQGRTTLVVSHRLSTIVKASRIVYVEQGAVLEQGTHEELVEKKGAYWKLLQEDMTHRSVANLTAEEVDDEVVEETITKRSRVRRNSSMCSIKTVSSLRESIIGGNRRLGSIAIPELPDLFYEEDEEPVEPVSMWKLISFNREELPQLAGGILASLIISCSFPAFALLLSKMFGIFADADSETILQQSQIYAAMFACCAVLSGLITFIQTWLLGLAGSKLTNRLRTLTFKNYLEQDQGWFDIAKNSVGSLCARLATDCAAVQRGTGTGLGVMLQGFGTMFLAVVIAMAYSWKITLVSLLCMPCVTVSMFLESWASRKCEEKDRDELEDASQLATEAVLNIRTIHSLGVERTILSRFSEQLQRTSTLTLYMRGPVYGICMAVPMVGYALSLAYGGYLVAREGLPYEYAILVSEELIFGSWMFAEALSYVPTVLAGKRASAKIISALERKPKVITEPTAVDDDWTSTGNLKFSNIHFYYPTRPETTVLRGLSLDLPAGRTLALVGPSGCGKSTIMHLLLRSYDPVSGNVTLDGRDIKTSLTLKKLRSQLGLVQQEPVMFERSIRENIAYGDNTREVPIQEIVTAAQMANVHAFIAGLPSGYETVLEAGSAALSGGQKQRVAIARALIRNPRVLLLDEATSALDAASEKVVQAALEVASKDRTTIIIAHRLATIRHADLICVVDKGVIAESGTHEELVRKRGLYWELLQQQGPTGA